MERMLSVGEVARLESMGRPQVTRLAVEGAFPGAYKSGPSAGGRWKIPEAGLQAYREGQVERLARRRDPGVGLPVPRRRKGCGPAV